MKRSGIAATTLLVSLVAASAIASPLATTSVPGDGVSINEDTSPLAGLAGLGVDRPRTDRIRVPLDPATAAIGNAPAVNTNKVYLNSCKPNGCVIRAGNTSSIDGSGFAGTWPINGTRTLAAFNQSDATFTAVVDCLKDIFGPYGMEFVTTNPSPSPHFEIMIAGRSTDLGLSANILGIATYSCGQQYMPNALVYSFANSSQYVGQAETICETAAQELAHSFNLDHVIEPSDPLTYFSYNGRQRFKNAPVMCGSDCVGGVSPSGRACTGTGSNKQIHACECSGQATQNSHMAITSLFGNGTPTPPTVKFVDLELGDNVSPGFPIRVEAADDNGLSMVQVFVDGAPSGALAQGPFAFNAPSSLANGTHTVKAVATDVYGTSAEAIIQVVIGAPCSDDDGCATASDVCIGGRCVTGPGVTGGLGATCTSSNDCVSGSCAQDSSGARYCVEPCALDKGECPDGFGCLEAGTNGICWPGFDEGGGGGCTSSTPAPIVPIGFGLAFGALLLVRRKRRS